MEYLLDNFLSVTYPIGEELNIKARCNTHETLWRAREITSVRLSAEQEGHTKCVSRCLKAMCHTFLACLSRAVGSAIEAIFLALHSRASV